MMESCTLHTRWVWVPLAPKGLKRATDRGNDFLVRFDQGQAHPADRDAEQVDPGLDRDRVGGAETGLEERQQAAVQLRRLSDPAFDKGLDHLLDLAAGQ